MTATPISFQLAEDLKLPKPVKDAQDAYRAAVQARKEAIVNAREAQAAHRRGELQDASPEQRANLKDETERAQWLRREADRTVKARHAELIAAIAENSGKLIESVPLAEDLSRVQELVGELHAAMDRLAQDAGTVKSIAAIDEPANQSKGFKPLRIESIGKHPSYAVKLAEVASEAEEMRRRAQFAGVGELETPEQREEREAHERTAGAWAAMARGAAVIEA